MPRVRGTESGGGPFHDETFVPLKYAHAPAANGRRILGRRSCKMHANFQANGLSISNEGASCPDHGYLESVLCCDHPSFSIRFAAAPCESTKLEPNRATGDQYRSTPPSATLSNAIRGEFRQFRNCVTASVCTLYSGYKKELNTIEFIS